MGSPEQVCGCALCAGLPGPFLVCSRLRHFALRFWNQTCLETQYYFNLLILRLCFVACRGIQRILSLPLLENVILDYESLGIYSHRNSTFFEIESQCESLTHEHVWVVRRLERPLHLFQLPRAEVGSGAAAGGGRPFALALVLVVVVVAVVILGILVGRLDR